MKIPPVSTIKTNININNVRKESKLNDIKSIKNYGQYLKEYGLK